MAGTENRSLSSILSPILSVLIRLHPRLRLLVLASWRGIRRRESSSSSFGRKLPLTQANIANKVISVNRALNIRLLENALLLTSAAVGF